MDAIINPRKRCDVASACRRIRDRWNREERHQRRRIAEAKQQELWRLLEAAWRLPATERLGKTASASGADTVGQLGTTGVLCFSS